MGILHQPFVYRLGPLEVGGFGFAMLMAFIIAQLVAQRELARRGHDPTPIGDLIIAAVIGGLVGAKLYYAILTQDAGAIFSRAGFVFWGGPDRRKPRGTPRHPHQEALSWAYRRRSRDLDRRGVFRRAYGMLGRG
jgi:hypothetical protein